MSPETKPSEPAMRAVAALASRFKDGVPSDNEIAAIIDESTQLPQILEALEEAKEMGDHIDLFQGLPLNRIFVQTFKKLDALLAAQKPS